MDHQTPAEEMPSLYRAVLDTVWRLERIGEREVALAYRRRAVHVYATRWDDGGRRELAKINREATRDLAKSSRSSSLPLEAAEAL